MVDKQTTFEDFKNKYEDEWNIRFVLFALSNKKTPQEQLDTQKNDFILWNQEKLRTYRNKPEVKNEKEYCLLEKYDEWLFNEVTNNHVKDPIEKSKGHICFATKRNNNGALEEIEFFEKEGHVYIASITDAIMPDGYRTGVWECSTGMFYHYKSMLLERYQAVTYPDKNKE